jgi:hypothetical protein
MAEARDAEGGDRPPEPRNRAGLFFLFIVAFLILIGVSSLFSDRGTYAPWIAHPDGRMVSTISLPHLHATRFQITKAYDQTRDDLFAQLDFSAGTGLSFHGRAHMFGLLGYEGLGKIPVELGATNEAIILARASGPNSSMALLTGSTDGTSQLLVLDHQSDPAHPHHNVMLAADQHLYPGSRGTGPTASGGAMRLTAQIFSTTDPLASVIAYYHAEFTPVTPAPETTSAALLLSPGDATNATHLSLLLQTSHGPRFIYVAADPDTKNTRIVLVEFNQ